MTLIPITDAGYQVWYFEIIPLVDGVKVYYNNYTIEIFVKMPSDPADQPSIKVSSRDHVLSEHDREWLKTDALRRVAELLNN